MYAIYEQGMLLSENKIGMWIPEWVSETEIEKVLNTKFSVFLFTKNFHAKICIPHI